MGLLTDRASLTRAMFRLLNTDAADDTMTEHDNTILEALYQLLQTGAEDAQLYLIDIGLGDYWLKATSSPLAFTGSHPNVSAPLPSDFLRLAGDDRTSALRKADGTLWGNLVDVRYRHRVFGGETYYVRNQSIYLARNAAIPSDVYAEYIYVIPTLADGTDADFPEADRPLIAAFAAVNAMEESWFAGGQAEEQKLLRNLERRKNEAWRRNRRSQLPRMIQPAPVVGENWIL